MPVYVEVELVLVVELLIAEVAHQTLEEKIKLGGENLKPFKILKLLDWFGIFAMIMKRNT